MSELLAVVLVFIGTVFGGFGSLQLKKASRKVSRNIFDQLKNFELITGAMIYVLASVIFIMALQFADLSLLYPLTSLSYVWVSLLSVKYLNEHMNRYKWLGVLIIMVGIVLVTR